MSPNPHFNITFLRWHWELEVLSLLTNTLFHRAPLSTPNKLHCIALSGHAVKWSPEVLLYLIIHLQLGLFSISDGKVLCTIHSLASTLHCLEIKAESFEIGPSYQQMLVTLL